MSAPVNDVIRDEMKSLFVGDRTLGDSLAPPLLFVAVNVLWGLGPASAIAIGAGTVVAFWRVRKGQQVVYAVAGLGAVGLAAFLALRSGRAESYFLPGIVSAIASAGGTFISIVVKRPLSAWSSSLYRKWPLDWYWRDDVRPAYSHVSWYWFWYFAIRGGVSAWLFFVEQPELLAAWKTATSWPTILPLLYLTYRVGVGKRNALGGPSVAEHLAGAKAPYVGGELRF